MRQIEIAKLMVAANNYSAGCVEALILGTPKDQLNVAEKPRKPKGVSPENTGRLEQEMEMLQRDLKVVEKGCGENVLNLTLAGAYIRKLLDNVSAARFLSAVIRTLTLNLRKSPPLKPYKLPGLAPIILFIFY